MQTCTDWNVTDESSLMQLNYTGQSNFHYFILKGNFSEYDSNQLPWSSIKPFWKENSELSKSRDFFTCFRKFVCCFNKEVGGRNELWHLREINLTRKVEGKVTFEHLRFLGTINSSFLTEVWNKRIQSFLPTKVFFFKKMRVYVGKKSSSSKKE